MASVTTLALAPLWERTPVCLREKPSDDGSGTSDGDVDVRDDAAADAAADAALESADPEAVILCRRCGHLITRPKYKIDVNGAHHHTFANPSGRVFEIGCFRSAEGCGPSGGWTDEFTWFRGHLWRLALCRACFVHLGWQFGPSSGSGGFWGLILNRLAFPI
ncbi:MAG: cereblon family protein [Desulfosarcinaceae bacterium]|nr:cereblon family protein [Desulfosarcinaceae bacterium]